MQLPIIAALATAVVAVTVPSLASAQDRHGYSNYGEHDRRYKRLNDRQNDNHEELNAVHTDVHD